MYPYPEKNLIPKVAKGVKGFKSKGKFFKIMGPKGEDRKAFQILEVRVSFPSNILNDKIIVQNLT